MYRKGNELPNVLILSSIATAKQIIKILRRIFGENIVYRFYDSETNAWEELNRSLKSGPRLDLVIVCHDLFRQGSAKGFLQKITQIKKDVRPPIIKVNLRDHASSLDGLEVEIGQILKIGL